MTKRVLLVALVACLAVPAVAQNPAGWKVRVDRSQDARDPDDTPDLMFMGMGKGFHVKGGPAGTFWNPANTATGNYTAKATFQLVQPSNHTNYYGLIFGGSDLGGAGQAYTYFVIAQNGTFLIRSRNGEQVQNVQARMNSAAIRQPDASGKSTNALEVRVAGDTVSYVVNGTVVHTQPKSAVKTDGQAGFRVNHMLEVVVEDFAVTK
jgi:hypothetical protein